MKKLFLLAIGMLFSVGMMAQQTVVNVTEGGLGAAVGFQKLNIQSLKIVGDINGDDVIVLREMAGADGKGALQELDLSEANIQNGGAKYFGGGGSQECYTRKNQITARMFWGCGNLRVVTIPNKVRMISNDAFANCPKLTEFRIGEGSTRYAVEDGILYSGDGTKLIRCPEGKHMASFTVKEGVQHIYTGAFRNLTSLMEINLPSTTESVSNLSFYGCKNLMTINIKAEKAPAMEDAFERNVLKGAHLNIPSGARESYTSHNGWREFAHIR